VQFRCCTLVVLRGRHQILAQLARHGELSPCRMHRFISRPHQTHSKSLTEEYTVQIRCSSLIIQQSKQRALSQLVARSSWALSKGVEAVEQGKMVDHCKHASLRKSLVHLSTLFPVSRPQNSPPMNVL
jgi:hypothetical protein